MGYRNEPEREREKETFVFSFVYWIQWGWLVATRLCLAGAQPEFDFLRFSFYSEGREERERRATKSKSDGGLTFWGGCALWPLIKSEDLRSRRQSVADQRFVPALMRPLSGLALLLKFFLWARLSFQEEQVEKCASIWFLRFVRGPCCLVFYGQGGVVVLCTSRGPWRTLCSASLGLLAEKPYDTHPENKPEFEIEDK
jgi:hypothetical protein